MSDDHLYVNINIRGALLERSIVMERMLDLVLAKYFSKGGKAMDDILNLLFCTERISMNSKWQILKYLIENRHNANDKESDIRAVKKIGKLIEERNVFAHLQMGNPSDVARQLGERFKEDDIIHFYKHKTETRIIGYSQQQINSLLMDFKECTYWLQNLYESGITYPPSE